MAIEGGEIVRRYLENLAEDFSCHHEDGQTLIIGTPYYYPNNDGICLYIKELPESRVKVSDWGEAAMNPFCDGFDLLRTPWAVVMAQRIARDLAVELDRGELSKSGPLEEVGGLMLDVAMAARGVSDLIYAHRAYARAAYRRKQRKGHRVSDFPEKLAAFLGERGLEFAAGARLTGGSGQVYRVHYRVNGEAYLQVLDPGRAGRAKAAVDRVFGMWADCNGDLTVERKLTLLNDEALDWKAAHIQRLSQVSTVVRWSERERLAALLAGLSG